MLQQNYWYIFWYKVSTNIANIIYNFVQTILQIYLGKLLTLKLDVNSDYYDFWIDAFNTLLPTNQYITTQTTLVSWKCNNSVYITSSVTLHLMVNWTDPKVSSYKLYKDGLWVWIFKPIRQYDNHWH